MFVEMAIGFVSTYPEFSTFLMATGFLRSVNKPLFTLVQAIVDTTDTKVDNEWWAKARESKSMKTALWLLDWTASIKLPKK